jgi:monoamine oxidase
MMTWGYRIDWWYKKLIEKMTDDIPNKHISYNSPVKKILYKDSKYTLSIKWSDIIYICNKIVFAIPPKVLLAQIDISDILYQKKKETLQNIPTWMSGTTKVVVQYKKPFWRDAWLSGNGVSHIWPLQQFHDTSPKDNSHGSLFAFVMKRYNSESSLKEDIISQLPTLFWEEAKNYTDIYIKNWSEDIYCSSPEDTALYQHPQYHLPPSLVWINDNSLIFSSAEMANTNGGVVEWALEVSEQVYWWL